jgi:hypothetical protein
VHPGWIQVVIIQVLLVSHSTSAGAMLESKSEIVAALNMIMGHHPKTDDQVVSVGANVQENTSSRGTHTDKESAQDGQTTAKIK